MSKITELHIPVSSPLRRLLIQDLEEDLASMRQGIDEISTALGLLRNSVPPESPADEVIESITVPTKRIMSYAARRRMSRAQKARWQKQRHSQSAANAAAKRRHVADRSNGGVSKDVKKKRHISAATRQKMSLAQQARRQKVAEAAGPSTVQATAEAEE